MSENSNNRPVLFNDSLKSVLHYAREELNKRNGNFMDGSLDISDLVLAMAKSTDKETVELFGTLQVNSTKMYSEIQKVLADRGRARASKTDSDQAHDLREKILAVANEEAHKNEEETVSPGALLLGILKLGEGEVSEVLSKSELIYGNENLTYEGCREVEAKFAAIRVAAQKAKRAGEEAKKLSMASNLCLAI